MTQKEGLVLYNDSLEQKLKTLKLELGFAIIPLVNKYYEFLRNNNLSSLPLTIFTSEDKMLRLLLIPFFGKITSETFNILLNSSLCNIDKSLIKTYSECKEDYSLKQIINNYIYETFSDEVDSVYINEPAHTINGARIKESRNEISLFGTHYYKN